MKQKKLKIGIVVDQLLTGGVQLAAIEQTKQFNKLGHKARLLILMRKKYPTDFSYLVKNIPYQYLSDSYPFFLKKTIKFPIFSFLSTLHLLSPILAPKVIRKKDYDILISWGTTTCLTTQSIYKKRGIPYVAVIHDPIEYILKKIYSRTFLKSFFFFLIPLSRYFEGSFVKQALETIIISKVHYNYLKKKYGIEAKIFGFGATNIRSIPKKRGNFLLSFGRWQKEKNPNFLLKILKTLPSAKLIIAGTWIVTEDLMKFKKAIKNANLEDRVILITHYDQKDLVYLCKKSRLWLHPHFEAFGLAALEAANLGLPIIIPRKSGITEKFIHGIHGFFPKKIDLNEYKKYINKLMSNERLAFNMGFAASNLTKKDFSWKANTMSLLELILERLSINKKSKILVLETGHVLGSALAGGDKVMEPMATKLVDKYNFAIIVPKIGSKHWTKAPFSKELIILNPTLFDYQGFPLQVFTAYCIRMFQTVIKIFRLSNPDFIYSSTNLLPDILPAFFAKIKDKKVVWISRVHHLIPPPHKREGIILVNIVSYVMQLIALKMIKFKSDIIIALNESLYHQLINLGFSKNKLKVLGAGIDYKKIISEQILPNTQSYDGIFVGRLHPAKGVYDLFPIWKRVTNSLPTANLAIVGDSPAYFKESIQKLIINEGLARNIKLLGYVDDKTLYSLMKSSKVFLFTDHESGWGIAVAEAMAAHLPVVGYDNGVLGSVYKKGYKKVKIADYDSFSEQIIKLIKNPQLRLKIGEEGQKEASKLDWQKTSTKFSSILDRSN